MPIYGHFKQGMGEAIIEGLNDNQPMSSNDRDDEIMPLRRRKPIPQLEAGTPIPSPCIVDGRNPGLTPSLVDPLTPSRASTVCVSRPQALARPSIGHQAMNKGMPHCTDGNVPIAPSYQSDVMNQTQRLAALSASRPAARRMVRRKELRRIVPLGDTTIYEMERRGEFPRRFTLSTRCVVWDLAEIESWLDARRQASDAAQIERAPAPDVRQRRRRPLKRIPAP